jgi:hypothetical protein
MTIARYEVELKDLKGAASYTMDYIAVPAEGEEAESVVYSLIDTSDRLLTLLKLTSLAAATDALVRVKSHYHDVNMAKVKGGPDAEKDLAALELEVQHAVLEVADSLDYEGDDGMQQSWTRSCTSSSSQSCRQCFMTTHEEASLPTPTA